MTAEDLASAFLAMDDVGMRARAAEIGTAIRAEDGVAAAIDFIERKLNQAR